jgi:DNA-binding transcriptional LysR family regulator
MPAFSRFLRYFTVVGRLGSIRRAAEELNISASAIDRQILAAEEELGVALFERLPTGLRLTSAGEMMMAQGLQWQKGLTDLRGNIEDLRGLKRGHVDIAVIDALARGAIPAMVRQMREDYPGITIGLHVRDNIHIADAIRSGTVDLGLLLDPRFSRDLTVRAHAEVALGFVTRPGHPLACAAGRRFAAAQGETMVMPAPPLALTAQVQALEGITGLHLKPAVTCDNIEMMKALVLEDAGVALMTSLDVTTEAARGELAFTRITDPLARSLTLALCVASPRQLSSAARLVLDRMEHVVSALGWDTKPQS